MIERTAKPLTRNVIYADLSSPVIKPKDKNRENNDNKKEDEDLSTFFFFNAHIRTIKIILK